MSIREQAAADARAAIGDAEGFGWPCTVTSPAGTSAALYGLSTDVSLSIDPETGMPVSGRRASVTFAMAHLTTAGLALPAGIADETSKPWTVAFDDVEGRTYTFKVAESAPDRAIGVVVCILEAYRGS